MSKVILVPVDGSEHSRKALEFAAELCSKFDGKLFLLHVLQSLPLEYTMLLGASAITVPTTGDELKDIGAKVIDAAKRQAGEYGCADVDTLAVLGDPAAEIVERAVALDADLIVMGSRGLSDIKGLLVGSVSHKVNHLAPCTCITVR